MTDVRGFERIVELLRRELGAENVFVLPEAVTPALAHTWIDHPLPNGRKVYVTFGTDIEDRDARVRRLEMLVDSFRETFTITGNGVLFTGLTLATGVATWMFSPLKFQADMGLLLAFMFMLNMLMAITVLPALAVTLDTLIPRRAPVHRPFMAH